MSKHALTVRFFPDVYRRIERYAARIGAPTINAAINALVSQGLDAVEASEAPAPAPHQRVPR